VQKWVTACVHTFMLWRADTWRPWHASAPESAITPPLKQTLQQGAYAMLSLVLGTLNNRAVDVLIGVFLGATVLGYVRLAWRVFDFVMQLALQPLVNVAISTFSALQADKARLHTGYRQMVAVSALLAFPLFLGMAAVAERVVPLVFGTQWQPAVVLMQVMSLLALPAVINSYFSPLMMSLGHNQVVFWQSIAQTVLSVTLTVLFAPWGVVWVLGAHVARAFTIMLLNLALQQRYARMQVAPAVVDILWPLLLAILMAAGVVAVGAVLPMQGWAGLAMLVGTGVILYSVLALALLWCAQTLAPHSVWAQLWHKAQHALKRI
ncbi:MAG: oligosaccharide flippase family protein, partial [Alphaproteobacteria bacterium]